MTESMTGSVTLGILAEDWPRHHQPARTHRDRPRRLEASRPMGLAGRRRSDRCSSRLSPAESRSRRRLTPQRLRSRPRLAQSPPRWRTHRRPSHQSVARTWVTQERRSYAGGCPRSASRNMPTSTARTSGPPRSRSGVGEGAVRGFAGTSLTTEVLLWTIRRMAVGLGPVLVLLGIAILVNFERIDAWQQRRFPDVRSLRRDGRARRSSCSEQRFSLARSSTAREVRLGPRCPPTPRSGPLRAEPRCDGDFAMLGGSPDRPASSPLVSAVVPVRAPGCRRPPCCVHEPPLDSPVAGSRTPSSRRGC